MSFLDNMAGQIMEGALGRTSNPLAAGLLQMLNNHPGSIAGLVASCQQQGLGGIVSSWIGTGQNLPISADQIHQMLGSQQVQELAQKAGISTEDANSQLTTLLPSLVDKLTPNGQLPEHSSLLETGMSLLKSFEGNAA